jgi:hypothetical protein
LQEAHNDPACNDRQIRCETAPLPKIAEQLEVFVTQCGKDIFAQCVPMFRFQPDVPSGSSMVDDVEYKTEKAVNKIFPSPMLI